MHHSYRNKDILFSHYVVMMSQEKFGPKLLLYNKKRTIPVVNIAPEIYCAYAGGFGKSSSRPSPLVSSKPFLQQKSTYISSAKRSEEHTSELQSRFDLVCRLLLEKKS